MAKLSNSSRDGLKRLQLFNYESSPQIIEIAIHSALPTQITLASILVETTTLVPNFHYGILMLKENINDYMLPFNLISEKYKKLIVEESNF